MRSDMPKVIVERPRRMRGAELFVRKGRAMDLESLPFQESVQAGRRRGWNRKEHDDHLRPLERFVRSRLGKRWDDVYSEICAELNTRSTIQQHVKGHLSYLVKTRTILSVAADGSETVTDADGTWLCGFYVDPRDGKLCENVFSRSRFTPVLDTDIRPISDSLRYQRIDGIWYALTQKPIPAARAKTIEKDGIKQTVYCRVPYVDCLTGLQFSRVPNPSGVYVAFKRTLSRKELRRHGLNNDADLQDERLKRGRR